MSQRAAELRQRILELDGRIFRGSLSGNRVYSWRSALVPVSGKVIDAADLQAVVDSALDGWFTTGRFAKEFERKLARFVGVRSRFAGQFRFLRESRRPQRAYLAEAGRSAAEARR